MDVRDDDTTEVVTMTPAPRRVRARRGAFVVSLALLAGALVPALVATASWSHWRDAPLLCALGALALLTPGGELWFKRTSRFFAIDAVVTVMLLVGGPLPALAALLGVDLAARAISPHDRFLSPGALATYVSYGWAVLAGGAVLAAVGAGGVAVTSALVLIIAGLVWQAVNWAIARGLFAVLWQGHRPFVLAREEFVSMLPTAFALLALAAATAALAAAVGVAALIVLAPAVFVPTLVLPALARSRDVSRLNDAAATRLYVHALCAHLGVARDARRRALAAVALSSERSRDAIALAPAGFAPATAVRDTLPPAPVGVPGGDAAAWRAWVVARDAEVRWDGADIPAGYARGPLLSLESRVLAVAREWAKLTAAGGPRVAQAQAVLALELQAATRLDPWVVAAAGEIVHTEARFADLERFTPTLDRLPLPRVVRGRLLPWALGACA